MLQGGCIGQRHAAEGDPSGLRVETTKGNAAGSEMTNADQQDDSDGIEHPHQKQARGDRQERLRKADLPAKEPQPQETEYQDHAQPFETGTCVTDFDGEARSADGQLRAIGGHLRQDAS